MQNLDYIAAKCGVSKMTVSRALRNDTGVSEVTREMIMRVAREANYFPSTAKKSASGPSLARYYILFQSDYAEQGTFFSELVLSIQTEIFENGASCSLGIIKSDYSEFVKLLKMMQSEEISGVLVVGDAPIDYLNALLQLFENVVFVDYPGDARLCKQHNAVVCDNAHGSYIAVQHLLELGRKRILLLQGPKSHYFSKAMRLGYTDALSDYGCELSPELIISGNFQMQGAQIAIEQAIDSGIEFDAVFSNDAMACGAILALKVRGLKIPQDVAVVGFDGLAMGEAISPALTTVIADRNKMGKLAVQRMLALEDGNTERVKLSIFPELLVRQSCGDSASIEIDTARRYAVGGQDES